MSTWFQTCAHIGIPDIGSSPWKVEEHKKEETMGSCMNVEDVSTVCDIRCGPGGAGAVRAEAPSGKAGFQAACLFRYWPGWHAGILCQIDTERADGHRDGQIKGAKERQIAREIDLRLAYPERCVPWTSFQNQTTTDTHTRWVWQRILRVQSRSDSNVEHRPRLISKNGSLSCCLYGWIGTLDV